MVNRRLAHRCSCLPMIGSLTPPMRGQRVLPDNVELVIPGGMQAAPYAVISRSKTFVRIRLRNRVRTRPSPDSPARGHGAPTEGPESLRYALNQGWVGSFRNILQKNANHRVQEFASQYNLRKRGTTEIMGVLADGGVGKRLYYRERIVDNLLLSGAQR